MENSSLDIPTTHHAMRLHSNPFSMVKKGEKTIEVRLYDDKRHKLRVGDTITFINRANKIEKASTVITDLLVFPSFEELFNNIDHVAAGWREDSTLQDKLNSMYKYYSPEKENHYGVVAIYIKRV